MCTTKYIFVEKYYLISMNFGEKKKQNKKTNKPIYTLAVPVCKTSNPVFLHLHARLVQHVRNLNMHLCMCNIYLLCYDFGVFFILLCIYCKYLDSSSSCPGMNNFILLPSDMSKIVLDIDRL